MRRLALLALLAAVAWAQPVAESLPFQDAVATNRRPPKMPQLVGLSQSEAERVIAPLKLQNVHILAVEGGQPGRVMRQAPQAGEPTQMACVYVGTGPASVSSPPTPAPPTVPAPRPQGVSGAHLFALGQLLLGAFAWVGWIRIEEQARQRPLASQAAERLSR